MMNHFHIQIHMTRYGIYEDLEYKIRLFVFVWICDVQAELFFLFAHRTKIYSNIVFRFAHDIL